MKRAGWIVLVAAAAWALTFASSVDAASQLRAGSYLGKGRLSGGFSGIGPMDLSETLPHATGHGTFDGGGCSAATPARRIPRSRSRETRRWRSRSASRRPERDRAVLAELRESEASDRQADDKGIQRGRRVPGKARAGPQRLQQHRAGLLRGHQGRKLHGPVGPEDQLTPAGSGGRSEQGRRHG